MGQWFNGRYHDISIDDMSIHERARRYLQPEATAQQSHMEISRQRRDQFERTNTDWLEGIPRALHPERMVYSEAESGTVGALEFVYHKSRERLYQPLQWRLSYDDHMEMMRWAGKAYRENYDITSEVNEKTLFGVPICLSMDGKPLLLSFREHFDLERVKDGPPRPMGWKPERIDLMESVKGA